MEGAEGGFAFGIFGEAGEELLALGGAGDLGLRGQLLLAMGEEEELVFGGLA